MRRNTRRTVLLAGLVLAALMPTGVRGQTPPVPLDSHVRATVETDDARLRYVGRLAGWDEAVLRIDDAKLGETEIARRTLASLEVQRGEKKHTLAGALIGAAAGAAIGFAIGSSLDDDFCWPCSVAFTTPVGAVVGGGAGALVGSRIRTDRWEPVPVDRPAAGPGGP